MYKFKVGQKCICTEIPESAYTRVSESGTGGSGWTLGLSFTIREVETKGGKPWILWPTEGGKGIYADSAAPFVNEDDYQLTF